MHLARTRAARTTTVGPAFGRKRSGCDMRRLRPQRRLCVGLAIAIQHAIHVLRQADLEDDYEAAWDDWESSGERASWEGTVSDGLTDASR
jgi:hypothetical protein